MYTTKTVVSKDFLGLTDEMMIVFRVNDLYISIQPSAFLEVSLTRSLVSTKSTLAPFKKGDRNFHVTDHT